MKLSFIINHIINYLKNAIAIIKRKNEFIKTLNQNRGILKKQGGENNAQNPQIVIFILIYQKI